MCTLGMYVLRQSKMLRKKQKQKNPIIFWDFHKKQQVADP